MTLELDLNDLEVDQLLALQLVIIQQKSAISKKRQKISKEVQDRPDKRVDELSRRYNDLDKEMTALQKITHERITGGNA